MGAPMSIAPTARTAPPSPAAGAPPAARPTVAHTARFARLLARAGHAAPLTAEPAKVLLAPPRAAAPELGEPANGSCRARVRGDEHEPDGERDAAHTRGREGRREDGGVDAALDPAARQAAILAPPPATAPAETAEVARGRVSLEELVPALVRRIAWAGDGRKGTVRLELGAGAYAGATVLVHADHGKVRVEVGGVGADELRARLDERLRRHGLDVESVT
jgi:hypothetical protein